MTMLRSAFFAAGVLLCWVTTPATAQLAEPAPMPTASEVNAVRAANHLPDPAQVQAVMPAGRQQTSDALRQADNDLRHGVHPTLPNVGRVTAGGVDPGQLAEQFRTGINQAAPKQQLYVLISETMPLPSLQQLARDAQRRHVVLVLRGMVGEGMKSTMAFFKSVSPEGNAPLQLDPRLFNQYKVEQVPAFLLVGKASCQACGLPADALRVDGDVSIDFALDTMERAHPELADDLAVFRGRP